MAPCCAQNISSNKQGEENPAEAGSELSNTDNTDVAHSIAGHSSGERSTCEAHSIAGHSSIAGDSSGVDTDSTALARRARLPHLAQRLPPAKAVLPTLNCHRRSQ